MLEKSQELMQAGLALFTRIFMKYDIMEKEPIDIGPDRLSAASIHMIEAVGKDLGNTVTTLSSYFMITKGAVSQIVSRLHKDGFVEKSKRKGNDKEIILELTKKGWKAFEFHEKYNAAALSGLLQLGNKYSEKEIYSFLAMLNDIDLFFGQSLEQEKKK